jgi:hypothetical protein
MLVNFIPVLTSGCFMLLSFIVAVNFKQVNKTANRWLAIFLLCFAIVLLNEPLMISDYVKSIRIITRSNQKRV